MKFRTILLSALWSAGLALPLFAATPLGGLTVAVSPDGGQVVAGGDSRTLFILDPETLAVKARHWTGTSIVDLTFNKDGSVLVVIDSADSVYLYSTADWKVITEIRKLKNASVSLEAGLIVGANGNYSNPEIKVYNLADGAPKDFIPLPEKSTPNSIAINNDGSKIAVLMKGQGDDAEPKVSYSDISKDLKGFERSAFQQKNDGKTSAFVIYDVASKKTAVSSQTYYSDSKGELAFVEGGLAYLSYSNVNAQISPEGEFTLFKMPHGYSYGRGWSADRSGFFAGGLRTYSFSKVGALEAAVSGEVDTLPGWPEYFKGFSSPTSGSVIYGATSAHRVFRFAPDGSVTVTGQGF